MVEDDFDEERRWREQLALLAFLSLAPGELPNMSAIVAARPAWWARAACRGQGTAEFFTDPRAGRVERAKAVCAACPVAAQCLEAGLEETEGVWGGTTPAERREERRRRRRERRRAA